MERQIAYIYEGGIEIQDIEEILRDFPYSETGPVQMDSSHATKAAKILE